MSSRMRIFLLVSIGLTTTLPASRAWAQCLVKPDSIRPIVDARGVVTGFIFPKKDAQEYEHYHNTLVPQLTAALNGLQQENGLLQKKSQLQDTVVTLLQRNEEDLKGVVSRLDTALDKQETIIGIQKSQLKSANREKWLWRGVAAIAAVGIVLK